MIDVRPSNDMLEVTGSIAYNVDSRAWTRIRLKKEILDEFSQLRNRGVRVGYRMVFYRDWVQLFLATESIMNNKGALPILLFFTQE